MPEPASEYAPSAIAEVPPPSKPRCNVCASEMEFESQKCVKCGALQKAKDCVACGARIPLAAGRCVSCSTFQGWRRLIPGNALVLTLILSLISVITAIAPGIIAFVNRPSRTTALFVGTSADADSAETTNELLLIRVYNSGGLASVVEPRARLQFRVAGLAPAALQIVNIDQMEIPANGKADLRLDLESVQVFAATPVTTKETVAARLCGAGGTLQVWVKERDRWGELRPAGAPLTIELAGKQIREAVLQRMNGELPKKGCS
jgi:hypothetical protein